MFPSNNDNETKVTLETEMSPIPEDPPFHILLLGDWSGRNTQAVSSDLSKSNPIEIDRDNFEDILRKLDVKINLDFRDLGGNVLSINFTEFEDFHPDRIFQRLPLFANFRDIRQRLMNRQTFDDAACEVRSWLTDTDNEKSSESEVQDTVTKAESEVSSSNLLDQILGETDENVGVLKSQSAESAELAAFVKKLVKPYLVQTDTVELSNLLMIVDEVISDLMRKILHHPQFQAIESAWRGLYFLVRRVETDRELKIFLFDVSKEELTANLKSHNYLTDSHLYRILAQQVDSSWAIVCGNYTFSLNVDDAATLIRFSKIAADSNAPFISHIKPEIFGFSSFADSYSSNNWEIFKDSTEVKLWSMLRTIPEAKHLALALPRTLGRLPYGKNTEPTETFYFEEFISPQQHEDYLWTNPIFICSLLLAKTFRQNGWNISSNFFQEVEGLPVHLYQDEFESKTKPCAETLMTQNNYEKILDQGLIPLVSFKNEDRIRIGGFQSIAHPPSIIKGNWK